MVSNAPKLQNRIAYWRAQAGMSQVKLAVACATSGQNIGKWEAAGELAKVEWLQRVARALDRTLDDMLPIELSVTGDPETAKMLAIFAELAPEDRRAILRAAEGLARRVAA